MSVPVRVLVTLSVRGQCGACVLLPGSPFTANSPTVLFSTVLFSTELLTLRRLGSRRVEIFRKHRRRESLGLKRRIGTQIHTGMARRPLVPWIVLIFGAELCPSRYRRNGRSFAPRKTPLRWRGDVATAFSDSHWGSHLRGTRSQGSSRPLRCSIILEH